MKKLRGVEGKGAGFQGLQGSVGEGQNFEGISGEEGGISEKAKGLGQAEEIRAGENEQKEMNI